MKEQTQYPERVEEKQDGTSDELVKASRQMARHRVFILAFLAALFAGAEQVRRSGFDFRSLDSPSRRPSAARLILFLTSNPLYEAATVIFLVAFAIYFIESIRKSLRSGKLAHVMEKSIPSLRNMKEYSPAVRAIVMAQLNYGLMPTILATFGLALFAAGGSILDFYICWAVALGLFFRYKPDRSSWAGIIKASPPPPESREGTKNESKKEGMMTPEELRAAYKTVATIGWAMVASTFVFAILAALFVAGAASEGITRPAPDLTIFRLILLAVSAGEFFIMHYIRREFMAGRMKLSLAPAGTRAGTSPAGPFTAVSVVLFLFCEVICLFGLILFLLSFKPLDCFLFFGISLVAFTVYFPRYWQFEQWARKRGIIEGGEGRRETIFE